ncbi:MAG TPA: MFS transporter [Thermoleophilia bacterium]|nr:MFS transporter [Thermoleophilia bacterium]
MPERRPAEHGRRYSVLAALMVGSIMGPIDASIVNVTLPTIAQSFAVPLSAAQWVPMTYLMVISSLLLFFGRLGDIVGHKKTYLAGLSGFVLASALCSAASLLPSIHWLILFRAVQGVGAATMMSIPYAIITATFPPTERGRALGINAISVSAGLAIGPSLGGFLTHSFGWPAVFLINVPIGIFALLWARHVLPETKGQSGKVDVPGAITSFIALLSFLLFVNSWQRSGPRSVGIAMLLMCILSATAFLHNERRASSPLLDLRLFRDLTFSFANISALLNFMSQYVMVFLTPFYLQRLLLYRPDKLGLVMSAFPLAVMVVAPFSGSLSDRVGTRTLASAGAATCALALLLMSRLTPVAAPADVAWRLALFGLGTGVFQSPNNSAVMGSAPPQQLGVASGILATVRNVGMVLGVATGGTILAAQVSPGVLQQPSLSGGPAAEFLSGLRCAYLAGASFTGVAALTSLVRSRRRGGRCTAPPAPPPAFTVSHPTRGQSTTGHRRADDQKSRNPFIR